MTPPPITRFCLVRHGETDWNTERRLQGQLDIPLNTHGLEQAHKLSQALASAGQQFDALYVSDLMRTRQTAEYIARQSGLNHCTVHTSALRERHFGCFQGLTYPEAQVRMPEAYQQFKSRNPAYQPSEGESLATFSQRVEGFLQHTAKQHAGQTLLLVSHGGVLDIAYRLANQLPLTRERDFPIPNAALNWISHCDGIWRMERWADQSHLNNSLDEL
jgi:probable phosphoglycerate mutase